MSIEDVATSPSPSVTVTTALTLPISVLNSLMSLGLGPSAELWCSDTYCATLTLPLLSIAIANAAISAVDTRPSLLLSTIRPP